MSKMLKGSARSAVPSKAPATKSVAVKKPAVSAAKGAKNNLAVLAKLADLGLLSQVENLQVLSKLEKAGLSLRGIEEAGLLSFAERSGALKIIASDGTPGALTALGVGLLVAAGAAVVAAPPDLALTADIVAVLLVPAAIAALVGGNILEKVQKL